MEPKVVRADDARHISLYDVSFRYGVGSAESDGTLSMLEVTIPPKTLIKPHMHSLEDEYTLILDGTVGACLGENTVEEIPAGSWLVKPRSTRHAMWNVFDEPAHILEVVIPGGIERYFEQIAPVLMEHGPEWTQRYNELAAEFGLTIFDDWSTELKARYGITL
ncbi:MAG TPA: cupin domain-containing protein [Candidatus Limnocylindria bacterium]|nr:cupin domain-containing protein [Candidatus Limnocylindria bacterium]